MTQVEIKVDGMTCGGCERSIQNALTSRDGISAATADRSQGLVKVDFDPALIQQAEIEKAILEAGFKVGL
ncbi:MAG: heavy-metal-associated domain-containing protein [Chromatiales bacterium]|nr:heavy-metal-associated domain-containing protein [Chromatiales bacterium]